MCYDEALYKFTFYLLIYLLAYLRAYLLTYLLTSKDKDIEEA